MAKKEGLVVLQKEPFDEHVAEAFITDPKRMDIVDQSIVKNFIRKKGRKKKGKGTVQNMFKRWQVGEAINTEPGTGSDLEENPFDT